MKFSIAMTTYNGEKYLSAQLKSFAVQTVLPYELVVCDDDSNDRTIEILENFSKEAPFIVRIYRNEKNLGYIKNFEKAISLCEGEWIALSDQDDKWFSNKLETLQNYIIERPETKIVVHDYFLGDEELNIKPLTNIERLCQAGDQPIDMISGCATAFHFSCKAIILPIPDFVSGHDKWIHSIMKFFGGKRKVLDVPLMIYRRHSSNMSSSFQASDKKKTKFRKLLHYRVKNPISWYRKNLLVLNEISNRFMKSIFDSDAKASIIQEVKAKQSLIERRIKILEASFPVRQISALNFLLAGGYNNFYGIISFLNDVIRLTPAK